MPDLAEIRSAREWIAPYLCLTPVHVWDDPLYLDEFGRLALHLKLEVLQRAGSFKARGALTNILAMDAAARSKGVVAVSAGNHAIAVACAAHALDVSAKVVMHQAANPGRVAKARAYGAEVVLAKDIGDAFAMAEDLQAGEGRTMVHPFASAATRLGSATLGLDIADQIPDLDAAVIAVGGGGLLAGAGAAIKQVQPDCAVIGVEPTGADGLRRSLVRGAPEDDAPRETIADSMAPPFHTQATFEACRAVADDIVTVDDATIRRAMALAYDGMKLALEPAGAASLAALDGPLRGRWQGGRVCALLCGSNIDAASFGRLLERAET
jgi:threonine dehydratase